MKHYMKLNPAPFNQIREGKKTIELRLYDEKRRRVKVGDRIVFSCTEAPQEVVETRVKALHRFHNFAALYETLPLPACGYTVEELQDAGPEDMEAYYDKTLQMQYGVVGIEIELI